jgi:hypothetical protein
MGGFNGREGELFADLSAKIQACFGRPVDITALAKNNFLMQSLQYRTYRRLFTKYRPKAIVFCDNANMKAAIEAAHSLGVPTVDLQHSLISFINILYTYPELTHYPVETISDYILTYGDYWNSAYRLPSKRIAVGFPYLELTSPKLMQATADAKKQSGNIIVISGSYSKEQFIKVSMELADRLPERTIYYKLRLEDYAGWRERYPAEFAAKKNIKVIDNNEIPLYEYFHRCSYQIGVNSTALIEGMAFGLTTFILKTGWYEEMSGLYEQGHVFLVEGAGEIAERVREGLKPPKPLSREELFRPNSLENASQALALAAGIL